MTDDLHSPTNAGPQPTPGVRPAGADDAHPGAASNGGPLPGPLANLPVDEHPEILVGAAFAGGLVVAFVLKRFGR
ncbi:MAG: hypothetical protein V7607_5530 [Solirubrobacteraceae bacterium]